MTDRPVASRIINEKEERFREFVGERTTLLKVLHIMNADGTISADMRRKALQVQHLLGLFEDSLTRLQSEAEEVCIVDANCGNSYLGFLLFDELRRRRTGTVRLLGIDRNPESIARGRARAAKSGFTSMEFVLGKVAEVELPPRPNLFLSLHGCDLATDHALVRALETQARELAIVPCCHAELRTLLAPEGAFGAFVGEGILQVDMAAHLTDALRLHWLRAHGYSASIVEFVPSEHTPKNRLLRAEPGRSRSVASEAWLTRLTQGLTKLPWLLQTPGPAPA